MNRALYQIMKLSNPPSFRAIRAEIVSQSTFEIFTHAQPKFDFDRVDISAMRAINKGATSLHRVKWNRDISYVNYVYRTIMSNNISMNNLYVFQYIVDPALVPADVDCGMMVRKTFSSTLMTGLSSIIHYYSHTFITC